MANSIAGAVAALKDRVGEFLSESFVARLGCELGLCWRQTPLALPNLVALFARQILEDNCSMPELARRAGSKFTPEAYCLARGRLPMELLVELQRRVALSGEFQLSSERQCLWKGHRLWHVDGSSFSMPDTPALQKHFGHSGQQRKGCGFPVAHILCLFDVASGMIRDCILSGLWTHDMAQVSKLHPQLHAGDVLIGDRAFSSYAHLAMLQSRGVHLVVGVHQKRKIDFRIGCQCGGKRGRKVLRERVCKLGPRDQVVRWYKPAQKPTWMSQRQFDYLPESILVREIRRQVHLDNGQKQTITLITTLLDGQCYTPEDLLQVLRGRWAVEVNLRHLKTTMGMDVLRCCSVEGIEKELRMFLIVYNLVRLIMLQAAAAQQVPPDRISFADALYWVRHGDLHQPLPILSVVPLRPGRIEPRVLKRRLKQYDLLSRPRDVFRKSLIHRRK